MVKKKVKKSKKPMGGALGRIRYELSEALLAVIGKKIATRPELMKGLWKYIRKHELQDPNDKRTILFDDKFKAVFGADGKGDKCDMFYLAKGITRHLHRLKLK